MGSGVIYGACTAICSHEKIAWWEVVPGAMDSAAAKHLANSYGTLAGSVAAIAQVNFLYLYVGYLGGYVLIIFYVRKEKRHGKVSCLKIGLLKH